MTEIIAGTDTTMFKGIEWIIVTTQSGKNIWVNKSKYDPSAETITYEDLKIGDTIVPKKDSTTMIPNPDPTTAVAMPTIPKYRKGVPYKLTAPQLKFTCFGKQIIKKSSALDLIDYMLQKGMTNTISFAGM